MSDTEDTSSNLVGTSARWGVSPPYITTCQVVTLNGYPQVKIVGGGHANHWLRIIDSHAFVDRSTSEQMDGAGTMTLYSDQLTAGEHLLSLLLWNGSDPWMMSSRSVVVNIPGTLDDSDTSSEAPSIEVSTGDSALKSIGDDESSVMQYDPPAWLDITLGERVDGKRSFKISWMRGYNVKIVDALTHTDLTAETEFDANHLATVTLTSELSPGVHDLLIFCWDKGDWVVPSKAMRVAVLPRPVITTSLLQPLPSSLDGSNGVGGATVQLWQANAGMITQQPISGPNWQLNVSSLPVNPVNLVCRQYFPERKHLSNTFSEYSLPRTVSAFTAPLITIPAANAVMTHQDLVFSGSCYSGTTFRIVKKDDHGFYLTERQQVNLSNWSFKLKEGVRLPTGSTSVQVDYTYPGVNGRFSGPFIFRMLGYPNIIGPSLNSTQMESFTVSGDNGLAGATVKIYIDTTSTITGEAEVNETGPWSVTVQVSPGSRSLVAEQFHSGKASGRGAPRAFKIRPPLLNVPVITFPTATTVKFSGIGHYDENLTTKIHFTVKSGPGTAPPDATVDKDGKWETTSTNSPFGSYTVEVIQRIADNANGWIDSAPFTFEYQVVFPLPYDVTSTPDYWTTLSGKGVPGATVSFYDHGGTVIAPDVKVGSDNQWSSKANAEWGPTYDYLVRIRQSLNNQQSDYVNHKVFIPPKAPGIQRVPSEGLSPTFTGTCELNAQVNLVFSDSPTTYPAVVTGSIWSFSREEPFAEQIDHTITATQIAAQQSSPEAIETFRLFKPMIAVFFDEPEKDSEVGRDVTFRGGDGMSGATVYVFDYLGGGDLGNVTLGADGRWEITVKNMKFGRWVVQAWQEIDGRKSPPSDLLSFNVVLLAPVFTSPQMGGRLARTSMIEGDGMPSGTVDVFLQDAGAPLLKGVAVDIRGKWKGEVTLPVGPKVIWARQYFENQTSRDSSPLSYSVVPAPPVLESPVSGAHVGMGSVASGFGEPGDTVIVWMSEVGGVKAAQTTVQADGTWSVAMSVTPPAQKNVVLVTATWDGLQSDGSAARKVNPGTYEPVFEKPAEGQYVSDPVHFAGQGLAGEMQVRSWFNPEQVWTHAIVSRGVWQGYVTQTLPPGGHWCQIQQSIIGDVGGVKISATVMSSRFEVSPNSPDRKPLNHPDERSV